MSKGIVWLAVLLITLSWSIPAHPWAMEHRLGVPAAQNEHWPAGLADLLNRANRVYGYWVNANDWFFYSGDTEAFNEFLKRYSTLDDNPLTLVLHPTGGKTGRLGYGEKTIQYDWEVKVFRRGWHPEAPPDPTSNKPSYVALVELWLGGQIQLSGVEVPANIKVESGNEISEFVAAHQASRVEAQTEGTEASPAAIEAPTKEKPATTPTPAKPATFTSKRLLYGKIALTEDGSKTLSVVFDESGGTRSGHDVLYADVNFNGKFEDNEKLEAVDVKRYGTWLSTSTFTPINFDVPYSKKAKGLPTPCEITIGYRQYPRAGVAEDMSLVAKVRLRESPAVWEYTLSGSGKLTKKPENVETWRPNVAPTMEITTRADERRKGNLGIGLELKAGEIGLECRKAGEPIKAHVEIKKPDGTVVHRGDATLDKFVFG